MKYSERFKLVMLVDDNIIDTLISAKVIENAQFACKTINFDSAKSALSYLNDNANEVDQLPDMIFLDINMPEMNGFEFLEVFYDFPKTIKYKCSIVMLTSSLASCDRQRAISYPFVIKFMSKPLSVKNLMELKLKLVSES